MMTPLGGLVIAVQPLNLPTSQRDNGAPIYLYHQRLLTT